MSLNYLSCPLFQQHQHLLERLEYTSPLDIIAFSFASFRQQCREMLSYSESRALYREAENYRRQLQAKTRKVLTHSNPQLKNLSHLTIDPMQKEARDYDTLFGRRADAYVSPSSVASMFSPAAYLTELYREGKQLHASDKLQYLDKRRPDLQSMALSQGNQDAELTTLALSNEILLNTIKFSTSPQKTTAEVCQQLSTTTYQVDLPYHIPFASIEAALTAQNTRFETLAQALAPIQRADAFPAATRAAYTNHLSPELHNLLLEPVPADAEGLNTALLRHFGTADIEKLSDAEYFCQLTGISRAELDSCLALPGFTQSLNTLSNPGYTTEPIPVTPDTYGACYVNGLSTEGNFISVIDGKLRRDTSKLARTKDPEAEVNLLPNGDSGQIRFIYRINKWPGQTKLNTVTVKVNTVLVEERKLYNTIGHWMEFVVPLKNKMDGIIEVNNGNDYTLFTYTKSQQPLSAGALIRLSKLIRFSQKTNLSPAALDTLITLSVATGDITEDTQQLTARALEYQQRYALSEDDALVLAGASINAYAPAGELSQFDRLFNHPPLNGVTFTTSDTDHTINFDPDDKVYVQERAVLKRALGVDDAELVTLATIAWSNGDLACARSLLNLSTLYRVGLLARVHGLTPQELQRLLQLNDRTEDLLAASYSEFADYLEAVYNTSQWLASQHMSVAELNVMTTTVYPNTMTPEIDSFIRTLYSESPNSDEDEEVDIAGMYEKSGPKTSDVSTEVWFTHAIRSSTSLTIGLSPSTANQGDYDARNILTECRDVAGKILKSTTINCEHQEVKLQMPAGTVSVTLTVPLPGTDAAGKEFLIIARLGSSLSLAIAVIESVHSGYILSSESDDAHTLSPLNQRLAPHIAAAFGLADVDSAVALQMWIQHIAVDLRLPLNNMTAFLYAIVNYCENNAPAAESAKLATFCQALGQLAFIIKRWRLSSAALHVAVYQPSVLQSNLGIKLSLTLETQQALGRFNALQLCAGDAVGECLTLLENNKLNAAALARWLNVPQSEVMQAVTCVGASGDKLSVTQAAFALDWLAQAARLGVSVKTVNDLLTCGLNQTYDIWQNVAGAVLAGIAEPMRKQTDMTLDEALSTALCAFFLATVGRTLSASIPMQNRDDVFSYLLIDNQVSGHITTSCIAEAISSVQLYINRCLQGMEVDVDSTQLSKVFFTQWEQYNKRYSTWAGVSQLVYYPENYVDPTLRYNQSNLQRQLLNELNQSQLNNDSVETAYLNYLNGFEDIANLQVLSGYHHGVELNNGTSYFVGRSTDTPCRYYWRSLNHEASDGTGGYVPSAWTDWEEIQTQVNAINDEVRPVLFNNRLYIGWIAQQMVTNGVNENGEPIQKEQYSLQLSYRKINGSWAPATAFALPAIPTSLFNGAQPKWDLYLSYHPQQDAVVFMLYDPALGAGYYDNHEVEGPAYGGFIHKDMQCAMVVGDTTEWGAIYSLFSNNLNSLSEPNKVIRYISAATYSATMTSSDASGTPDPNLLVVSNVAIDGLAVDNQSVPPELSYTVKGSIEGKQRLPVGSIISGDTYQHGVNFSVTALTETATSLPEHLEFKLDVTITFAEKDTIIVLAWCPDSLEGTRSLELKSNYSGEQRSTSMIIYVPYWSNSFSRKTPLVIKDNFGHIKYEQEYIIGYTNDSPPNTYTYNWGGADIALPESGTTDIGRDYVVPIPADGLQHPRILMVKQNGSVVYTKAFRINVSKNIAAAVNPTDNIQIIRGDNRVSYLEYSGQPKRTRLNTLFANELVNRARAGLDNVLSWDTQQLPESAPGKGFYVDVVLNPYDPKVNGAEKWFRLYYSHFYKDSEDDKFMCYEGMLSDTETVTARIFYPYPANGWAQKIVAHLLVEYASGLRPATGGSSMKFTYAPETNTATADRCADGIWSCNPDNINPTEPMDFSGANGLYFWELFYYTPMMTAEKLLQSQDFEECERWLKYVFSPSGYLEGEYLNRYHVDRMWNTRPLEEDTAWDDTQTDTTDPDVVAQADPMHYKVATLMKLLDLMIARGDMAYRQLERDTLAEARMWYLSAQQLLGPQPDLPTQDNWSNPTLSLAASHSTQTQNLMLMERLASGDTAATPSPRTANSLNGLFLPVENDKLNGYWQTLAQRLFNLRHNLSIDGQPLTLPLYATPAAPKALQSAAAAASAGGGSALPTNATIAIQRFPVMLESARNLVGQLIQYGSTLTSVLERKDGEALNVLMHTQAQDLMQRNLQLQDKTIEQLQAEQETLTVSLNAAVARRDSYQNLLNEGVSAIERQSIDERIASGSMATAANIVRSAAAALDLAPNVFGLAVGGSKWGAPVMATAIGMDVVATGLATSADAHAMSEQYRRRQQEWTIQYDIAAHECTQLEAQQHSLAIQLEAARLQRDYVAAQQTQTQAQLDFFRTRFSNEVLYSWMQGRLSAVFYQFYDLVLARCMRAQLGYQWETRDTATFIQPGAWDSNHAGLLSGEALLLNLAQMESAYLEWDGRSLEVNRTVSMAKEMHLDSVAFNAEVNKVLSGTASTLTPHTLAMNIGTGMLIASINLNALAIAGDYPDTLVGGSPVRRIKQVSVSLPALLGPYQDIQAVLGYNGNGNGIHQSCMQTAISHGVNDSGQFQLDFNDSKYLPFEGLPIDGAGTDRLTLTFPNVGNNGKQKAILQSLNDILLHIRYTIRAQ